LNTPIRESYSSASSLPAKLLKKKEQCVSLSGNIIPIHFQLCPTNVCNLNCSFCSCSKREKGLELSYEKIEKIITDFTQLGSQAVTITGGGEPCCHPDLSRIIQKLTDSGIQSGLVTNGIKLPAILDKINLLTWCRVSVSDDRNIEQLLHILKRIIPLNPSVDWAFSYVITKNFNEDKFAEIIKFANEYKLTHVRAVSDLLDLSNAISMDDVWISLNQRNIPDDLVLYQSRTEYTGGQHQCLISLLKPVIAPDGYMYPCCGVQYALPGVEGIFPIPMRMCSCENIIEYFKKQIPFNGIVCEKCYYSDYNTILSKMIENYDHEVFV